MKAIALALTSAVTGLFATVYAPSAHCQTNATQSVISSQKLDFSIVSTHVHGANVSAQIRVHNGSNLKQYLAMCISQMSNASLASGQLLNVATETITGIPTDAEANIDECFTDIRLGNMVYLDPSASMVFLISWRDPWGNKVSPQDSISFSLNLAVRTTPPPGPMDSPTSEADPGPLHLVSVSFPLVTLSGPQ